MDEISETKLRDHPSLHGALLDFQLLSVAEAPGVLLLELRAGGDGFSESHHLIQTDARQVLELAARIRHTVLPDLERKALDLLEQIVKE